MIKIHFTSGLGNQLFQFFFGESLSIKHDIKAVYIDSCLPPDQLKLWDIFEINKENKYSFELILSPKKNKIEFFYINFIRLLIKFKINLFFRINSDNNFKSINNFDITFLNKNNTFYGYWQNYNFFNHNFFEIKKKLKFKKKLNIKNILPIEKKTQLIGIHIRGGDYDNIKNKKIFFQVSKNYYSSAVKKVKDNFPDSKLLVFSDDLKKAKKILKNINSDLTYITDLSKNRDDDFQYLSQCDHFVIPNSTFSLWAAYISSNKEKTIIAPNNWIKNNLNNFIHIDPSLLKRQ